MSGKPRWAQALLVAVLAGAGPPTALAETAERVKGEQLGEWHAKDSVVDTVLKRPPTARVAQAKSEAFTDQHGHTIALTTSMPDLDLRPYAETLASIYHHDELVDLVTHVLRPEEVEAVCGPEAAACYLPEDVDDPWRGEMYIPAEDPDLLHIIVHEYGHHVDNQLLNLAHIFDCPYSGDGSRNWFFERDWDDDLFSNTSCSAQAQWNDQLAELYAEDFTWLNGNRTWRPDMTLRSPSNVHLGAMKDDFDQPLTIRRYATWRPWIRARSERYKRVQLRDWTFLSVEVHAPRRSDFDVYIYRANGRRHIDRSIKYGRRERALFLLQPGSYDVGVYADRGLGRARVRVVRG